MLKMRLGLVIPRLRLRGRHRGQDF